MEIFICVHPLASSEQDRDNVTDKEFVCVAPLLIITEPVGGVVSVHTPDLQVPVAPVDVVHGVPSVFFVAVHDFEDEED